MTQITNLFQTNPGTKDGYEKLQKCFEQSHNKITLKKKKTNMNNYNNIKK